MFDDPCLDNLPNHYNSDSQKMSEESYDHEGLENQDAVHMKPFNGFKEALSHQPPLIQEE